MILDPGLDPDQDLDQKCGLAENAKNCLLLLLLLLLLKSIFKCREVKNF